MEAHTRQCRTPQLAPVVCQLTTQSGRAVKGSKRVYWCYVATSTKVHIKNQWVGVQVEEC